MKETNRKFNKIKNAINSIVYKELVNAIKETMNITGRSFIIGDFPYWRDDCSFIKTNHRPSLNIKNAKCIAPGYIKAELAYNPAFFNEVFSEYGFILHIELEIFCENGEDHVLIDRDEDFKLLKNIRTPYWFINTEEDIRRSQKFIDDYEKLVFMNALKNYTSSTARLNMSSDASI